MGRPHRKVRGPNAKKQGAQADAPLGTMTGFLAENPKRSGQRLKCVLRQTLRARAVPLLESPAKADVLAAPGPRHQLHAPHCQTPRRGEKATGDSHAQRRRRRAAWPRLDTLQATEARPLTTGRGTWTALDQSPGSLLTRPNGAEEGQVAPPLSRENAWCVDGRFRNSGHTETSTGGAWVDGNEEIRKNEEGADTVRMEQKRKWRRQGTHETNCRRTGTGNRNRAGGRSAASERRMGSVERESATLL